MKDSLALFLAGVAAAGFAWAFWYYLGENGMQVLTTGMLVLATLDNIRLRRVLKKK
jgi:hypothetical protein